jgi:RNA polymerase-binding transcription factor DksA
MTMPQPVPDWDRQLEPAFVEDIRRRLQEARDYHIARVDEGAGSDDDITAALVQRSVTALLQVEKALEALTDGSYGICTSCQESITPERLDAVPHALECVRCASVE